MAPSPVTKQQAHDFLSSRYGAIDEPVALGGGFWSSAFAFSHAGRNLVVRFGPDQSWFEADRAAMAFASPDLPVPEVLEIGPALGGACAVSVRCFGVNLEDVDPDQRGAAAPMLTSLLGALFRVPTHPDLPVAWHPQAPRTDVTWRGWLEDGLVDDPARRVHGWREAIAVQPAIDRIFRVATSRIDDLLAACPDRRDLVHGDLLHANVLVAEDGRRPTGVFSWKCSVRGDFLYDTAWCTFWSAWHPGIAAIDVWTRIWAEPSVRGGTDALVDAPIRHHCYELHVGATHLGWNAWVGDHEELERVAHRLTQVLERGPLAQPYGVQG